MGGLVPGAIFVSDGDSFDFIEKPRDEYVSTVMFLLEKVDGSLDPRKTLVLPRPRQAHMFQAEELSLLALSFARLSDPGCEPIFDQIVASLTPRRLVKIGPVAWAWQVWQWWVRTGVHLAFLH